MTDTQKLFDSSFNYQKIALKDSRIDVIPTGGTTSVSIPHSLNRITSARVWYDPGLGKRFMASPEQYVDDTSFNSEANLVTVAACYLTTTDLVIEYANNSLGSVAVITYYRIYYDA